MTTCIPLHTFAAEIIFKALPNTIPGDNARIIEVRIDPHARKINTVDGVIGFRTKTSAKISSVLIETGGSILSLWTVKPSYSAEERVIRFTGGVPRGFEDEGLLFRMRIFVSQPGDLTISWFGGSAYRNDGLGTKETISARSITTQLSYSEPNQISAYSKDSTPPSFDNIEIGQDSSVYDGKYFMSFHASDDISGIKEYTVNEGGSITTISDGVYVLKDQNKNSQIMITAYDQSGNSRSVTVPIRSQWSLNGMIVFIYIIILLIFI